MRGRGVYSRRRKSSRQAPRPTMKMVLVWGVACMLSAPSVAAMSSPFIEGALESSMRSWPVKLDRSVLKAAGAPMAVKLAALRVNVACCQPELAASVNGVVEEYPVAAFTKNARRMDSGLALKLSKSIEMVVIPAPV